MINATIRSITCHHVKIVILRPLHTNSVCSNIRLSEIRCVVRLFVTIICRSETLLVLALASALLAAILDRIEVKSSSTIALLRSDVPLVILTTCNILVEKYRAAYDNVRVIRTFYDCFGLKIFVVVRKSGIKNTRILVWLNWH
jgi:hypothetical protein